MNKKIKRLSTYNDIDVYVEGPFSSAEIMQRDVEYKTLSPEAFQKKYISYINKPSKIGINGKAHSVQLNFCTQPFCKLYGLDQKRYTSLRSKPSRYKIIGSIDKSDYMWNDIPDPTIPGIFVSGTATAMSNWSICEEISRLIKINSVTPLKSKYKFHTGTCLSKATNPFDNPKDFHKRGKSTAGSQKYQCKECKKCTNVLPAISGGFNYHQRLDGILIDFAKDIMSHMPVRRTCEKLKIGSNTYYSKLEILYKRCLEFLELHETQAFKKINFDEIMINTDSLQYYLNNIRLKGKGKKPGEEDEMESKLLTYLIASVDINSGYAFRSDIAYDFDINLRKLLFDTNDYHCDRSYPFLRKNNRLQYSYFPKFSRSVTRTITPKQEAYEESFFDRLKYVEGCHVHYIYTAAAHLFLLKELTVSDKWHFVTDDDPVLKSTIFRIFKDEIKSKNSHYFICQYPPKLTLSEAGKRSFRTRNDLNRWAKLRGLENEGVMEKARKYLEEYFDNYPIYEFAPGTNYPTKSLGQIKSPLATKSEGERYIDFKTDTTNLSSEELARIVSKVSNFAVDNFFQELRRRVNLLERPLMTARGDGKSYIYANYNPRYAQYLVTIFRTFYNFCWTKDTFGKRLTPAQKIGIADKAYTIKDIIYFK